MDLLAWLVVIAIAIFALKGFDVIAGRSSKQVKDGVSSASAEKNAGRIPCPECAEMIMPAAKKCPHCQSQLKAV